MPYVYALDLNEYRDAGTVQADWQAIASEGVNHAHGGVCVSRRPSGSLAVVVSTPREPNYADMETTYNYVDSVTEHKQIPSRGGSNWNPPHELAHGIMLEE